MSQTPPSLHDPLPLAGGQTLPNRIAKAAMEENMANAYNLPDQALFRLYERWAKGGAGLIITGNVMVSADAVTGPGGVVLDNRQPLKPFENWAKASKLGNGKVWMQINHPGRQVFAANTPTALAPSDVPMEMGGLSKLFAKPCAMTNADIARVTEQFATTASLAEKAGFDGVEIHAAHGYLISQFLSPRTNLRDDEWGNSLENRARFLTDIILAIRARVAPEFGVGVKLNSADFQKGGFEAEDAIGVVKMLNALDVDLVEISGGSYESQAMMGKPQRESTRLREAYFLDFARDIQAEANMPIMVTGGITRKAVAEDALQMEGNRAGVSMVGLGQAMAFAPDLPALWRAGEHNVSLPVVTLKNKGMAGLAKMSVTKLQLRRMGQGKDPKPNASPVLALISDQMKKKSRDKKYRKWLATRNAL